MSGQHTLAVGRGPHGVVRRNELNCICKADCAMLCKPSEKDRADRNIHRFVEFVHLNRLNNRDILAVTADCEEMVSERRVNEMHKAKVLIAGLREDGPSMCMLQGWHGSEAYELVGRVCGEAELRKWLLNTRAEVVLIDASISSSFDLCRAISCEFPAQCIIMVGGRRNYDQLKSAIEAGARGYVAEDECAGDDLYTEIERIISLHGVTRGDAGTMRDIVPEPGAILPAVMKVVQFIQENYQEGISFTQAAEYAGLSESYLRKCLRRELGMSFVDCLTRHRIRVAKEMLSQNSLPIARISMRTGFSSARYFCYVFKRETGMTPKEYKMKICKEARSSETGCVH